MFVLNDLTGFSVGPQKRLLHEVGGYSLATSVSCTRGTKHEWENLAYIGVHMAYSSGALSYAGDYAVKYDGINADWTSAVGTNINEEHISSVMSFKNITSDDYDKVMDHLSGNLSAYIRLIGGLSPATFVNRHVAYATGYPVTSTIPGTLPGDFIVLVA